MKNKLNLRFPHADSELDIYSDNVEFLNFFHKIFYQYATFVKETKELKYPHTYICVDFCAGQIYAINNDVYVYEKTFEALDILMASKCATTLVRNIVSTVDSVSFFHGSVIQVNRKNFLFLGFSGAGKTTLTTFLCHQPETKYVSEDLAIVNCETLKATAFFRPLFIRTNSFWVLKKEYGIELSAKYDQNFDRYLCFPTNFLKVPEVELDACFFLDFEKNSEIAINPMVNSERIRPYVECSYLCSNYKNNISNAIKISTRLPTFMLTYSDMKKVYNVLYNYRKEEK